MRKTLVIAVREYRAAVRTKSFIISLVIMPVMGSAGLIAAMLFKDQVNISDKKFAIIDRTGRLFDQIATAAEEYNRTRIFDSAPGKQPVDLVGRTQIKPRFVVERVVADDETIDEVRAQQSDRVRQGELTGFVEIGAGALDPSQNHGRDAEHVVYHSNNPMYYEFRSWLEGSLNEFVRAWRYEEAKLDRETVEWATQSINLEQGPLYTRTAAGRVLAGQKNDQYFHIAASVALSLLMFMVILVGAMPLTYSVLEEKIQRSAEVLLGSVTPFQFMMGKLLGMVGVSLTIVTIYLVIGFFAACYFGYGHTIPQHLINWFILYQAGAILMFGSMYIAIGAACNDMKDAQNLMTPASLVACIPLFLLRPVMLEPNSTFSTLVSFFPPATPVLMLLRQGLPQPVPVWQPVVGLLLVVLTSIFCVGIAGRIFHIGILMQGKGASLKEILRWALRGDSRAPTRPRRRRADAAPPLTFRTGKAPQESLPDSQNVKGEPAWWSPQQPNQQPPS